MKSFISLIHSVIFTQSEKHNAFMYAIEIKILNFSPFNAIHLIIQNAFSPMFSEIISSLMLNCYLLLFSGPYLQGTIDNSK